MEKAKANILSDIFINHQIPYFKNFARTDTNCHIYLFDKFTF